MKRENGILVEFDLLRKKQNQKKTRKVKFCIINVNVIDLVYFTLHICENHRRQRGRPKYVTCPRNYIMPKAIRKSKFASNPTM